ncbi:ATP-binding cassette domain-containing protein [Curvibacter sp. RS43]|uniref:ABC transporter ATP-binding protein n=1 Tax=Curvibacter microcysteis TaxID=3026419 RepID=UPI002360CB26|nr:ATP-binding cassette domain-containing protein [Curvibacter sp. RS43]MDD0811377.1 ATP-binding cassette domain-containing protein [Curvibacter sp. RS43]
MLSIQHITKRYRAQAVLRGIALDVAPGEFISLLGPSGCGKTTLLRILCGIESPDTGSLTLRGQDITAWPAAQRRFGVVFQSYALFPNLSAAQNVAFGLQDLPRAQRAERVAEMLALVGLGDQGHKLPSQLSGGQQQRVALARALAPRPELLLLDEPLSALDAQVRGGLQAEIRRLQQQLGITTVMVTHDQDEALSMADRVVVMHEGRIEQQGTPQQLYARPETRFVAGFVGRMNLLPARVVAADTLEVGSTRLHCDTRAYRTGSTLLLGLRPEAVQLQSAPAADQRLPANSVRARLVEAQFHGPTALLRLHCDSLQATLDAQWPTGADARLPEWLHGDLLLSLPAPALHALPLPESVRRAA